MGNAAWRYHGTEFQWTDKFSDDLLKKVATIKPAGVEYNPVILLFGPTGHGKSSFINSISTISKGRKSNIAGAARASKCVTTVYRKYEIEGKLNNVTLADIQGIVQKDDNKFLIENALAIVDGQVKPEYTVS
ncbi:interferon-induced protein 44-like [Mercenaria mercenaria]|uniref:interferon-induced protein 44-like n=1 Tax=Mercenaria mercenaria TaxID=6596 RepID=UPI00234F47A7|nr:interferon-induced protein 44-like [Mercenaria mercenaria]